MIHQSLVSLYKNRSHLLFQEIDWGPVTKGNHAIVDPTNQEVILYVKPSQYNSLLRVALSNESEITILATAGEKPDSEDTDSSSTLHSKGKGIKPPMPNIDLFMDISAIKSAGIKIEDNLIYPTESNLGKLVSLWGHQLHFWTRTDTSSKTKELNEEQLSSLAAFLSHQYKHQGAATTIKRMKIYLISIERFVAGNPLDTEATYRLGLGVQLRNGLPACLNGRSRALIRAGHPGYIRTFSSIFNMYRAIGVKTPPAPSYTTITDTPKYEGDLQAWKEFVPKFWKHIHETTGVNPYSIRLLVHKYPITLKAGANASSSFISAPFDAFAWSRTKGDLLGRWCQATGNGVLYGIYLSTLRIVN
jgi:hypothetical protein